MVEINTPPTAADLVIQGAREVVTCEPGPHNPLGIISEGVVAVVGGKIMAVGRSDEVRARMDLSGARILDIKGQTLAPGFVDCHTHVVFGGSRAREFSLKMTKSAAQIEAMGIQTGIPASIAMTRAAHEEHILADSLARVQRMFCCGSTTIESKTGYGISVRDEDRLLKINSLLQLRAKADIVSTFTGAHDFPPEIDRNDPAARKRYMDLLINEMIPKAGDEGLAEFCDVYCDDGYYTAEESRVILKAGMDHGLVPRIHTDAYANIGGSTMAAHLPTLTADHLNYTTKAEMALLAENKVIGVVLPALDFAVAHPDPVKAADLIEAGVTIALGTNLNPGNWTESMQLVMQLACRNHGLTLEQAILAATLDAARALGREKRIGSISPGKVADLQVWDITSLEDIIYRLGHNAVTTVIKSGDIFTVPRHTDHLNG
ncbi:imidazolonepropionase [Desulforhopalus singaporensis]|uniref:Imidazolonepropionase n=1 Tax=Desulforhopalus singaporensis TaxID=91360 RepID=A0A1H0UDF2_9BACT|nr:imidazolonepropionase [Desulforhopalus singaporensis]SDP64332.1 imidazolonepropionase [Desulforhopalus singaporensis]